MQTQERLIAPGLGVVILLSAAMLGVPMVYKLLLGLLGLVAAGTYFAPFRVQVETRIGIAALGLIILLIVSSTAFWLTLLSFGAMAALQFPHRRTLQRNLATVEWLSAVFRNAQARWSGKVAAAVDGEETEAAAGDGASTPPGTAGIAVALPSFVRMNVAGVGGVIAGVIVLGSVFMPWYGFLGSVSGELVGGGSFSLRAGAEEFALPAVRAFFYLLLVLGVLSIVSIGLPRLVAGIIAAAGFVVTLASYLYVSTEVERVTAELRNIGADVTTIPAAGCWIAGFVFLVMLALQLIPAANRFGGKE